MGTKTNKAFHCISYKREVQARIYDEIVGLSPQEERAYFAHAAEDGPLAEWWRAVKSANRGDDANRAA
jgi:hypothetical protein